MNLPILSCILLCPTVALALILITPSYRINIIRLLALAASLASLILSTVLMGLFDPQDTAMQFTERLAWLPDMGINYTIGVDGLSVTFVLLAAIVLFCGIICSWAVGFRVKSFFVCLMCLATGIFGVFVSLDLFLFLSFYGIAVLPMYLLTVLWGSERKEYAGMKLVLYLLTGSALLTVGCLILYALPDSGTFDLLHIKDSLSFDRSFQDRIYPLFCLGFIILSACFPFHSWAPDGHAAAPPAAGMLHAGVLTKLGAYGIIRIGIFLFPQGAADWAGVTATLALAGILYGAAMAVRQRDLGLMIGFLNISAMGFVLLGISALNELGLNGALFQMFSHGIVAALLFACIGHLYNQCRTRNIDELGGLSSRVPALCVLFVIAGLAGLCLPGLSGFPAMLFVFWGAVNFHPFIGIAALGSLAVTAYCLFTALQRIFCGPLNPRFSELRDLPPWQFFPRAVLIAALLLFGIFPGVFINWIQPSVRSLLSS